MTLTFDLTHDLDLGCFKVKFRTSCISGIVGLIDVKLKESKFIGYWANSMTLPFDHTRDLDLAVSKSESEIALSQPQTGVTLIIYIISDAHKSGVGHRTSVIVRTGQSCYKTAFLIKRNFEKKNQDAYFKIR